MAEAVSNEVAALRRIRFGPIELGGLAEGQARRLTDDEIASLWEDASV
jgi:16S rRNA U516 pseudouridylate synthase RsuA-like enzyme